MFCKKDLQPKLDESTAGIETQEDAQEQDDDNDENKHEEEEQDEDKIEEGGGGDDEIDENEQEKSNMEIERDEVDIVDEDKETEESDGDENQTDNTGDHDEDGSTSTEHTHEAREEHYKADDASSAVITQDPENVIKNGTLYVNSSENVDFVDNSTIIQEKDSESTNATLSVDGPPANTTSISTETTQELTNSTQDDSETLKSNDEEDSFDQSKSENLESNNEDASDPTHLEEKEVRNDLETLPEIETEGVNTAAE
ncbi:hypothetical protein QVD17_05805 [Tagetes erecta]|uniref:Uncharacterized protein n=1 Tax=Tagetes erecta TaxID=13708 RepID=A0AAD8P5U5_TARER|nr:hypothetical protein QVD17_05805 [Tagetes erecta]